MLGAGVHRLASDVRHAITENLFTLPDGSGTLMARWGQVPAHGTVDPGAVDPIDEPSWLLDLDAYSQGTRVLNVEETVAAATKLAERIYSFFRWVVTNEFLKRYGGDV